MILADENIDFRLIEALRISGFNVLSIYESKRGIQDEQIIELSRNPPRVILTEDKDFGEWVFAHNVENISVIFLRYSFSETERISKILIQLLKDDFTKFVGNFTTLTCQKLRRRKI